MNGSRGGSWLFEYNYAQNIQKEVRSSRDDEDRTEWTQVEPPPKNDLGQGKLKGILNKLGGRKRKKKKK